MRPMFFEFPGDFNNYSLDTQYMLGPNLLVAPVFTEEGEVTFYVPDAEGEMAQDGKGGDKGEWTSFFDHSKKYVAGKWYTETHDFTTLPLLLRPGSVTAVNWKIQEPQAKDLMDGLELLVCGNIAGGSQIVEVVSTLDVAKVEEKIKVEMDREERVVCGAEGVKVTVL